MRMTLRFTICIWLFYNQFLPVFAQDSLEVKTRKLTIDKKNTILCVCFHPTDTSGRLFLGYENGLVKEYDMKQGYKSVGTLSEGGISEIVFDNVGNLFITVGNNDGNGAYVWDLVGKDKVEPRKVTDAPHNSYSVSAHPRHKGDFVIGGEDDTKCVAGYFPINAIVGEEKSNSFFSEKKEFVSSVAFNKNGKYLAITYKNTIKIFKISKLINEISEITLSEVRKKNNTLFEYKVCFSEDGKYLFALCANEFVVLDLVEKGTKIEANVKGVVKLGELIKDNDSETLALTSIDGYAFAGSLDGNIYGIDGKSKDFFILKSRNRKTNASVFSLNGHPSKPILASADSQNEIFIWHLDSLPIRRKIELNEADLGIMEENGKDKINNYLSAFQSIDSLNTIDEYLPKYFDKAKINEEICINNHAIFGKKDEVTERIKKASVTPKKYFTEKINNFSTLEAEVEDEDESIKKIGNYSKNGNYYIKYEVTFSLKGSLKETHKEDVYIVTEIYEIAFPLDKNGKPIRLAEYINRITTK